jgi:hypothetical protein
VTDQEDHFTRMSKRDGRFRTRCRNGLREAPWSAALLRRFRPESKAVNHPPSWPALVPKAAQQRTHSKAFGACVQPATVHG